MSETFDLAAFIDGSSYPRKDVTVYTNVAALKEAEDIQALLAEETDLEKSAALENRLDLVRVDIEKSALVFEMQGMPFRLAQDIADIFNEDAPASEADIMKLVHTCIQGVRNASGAKSSVPTEELLADMQRKFSPAEFNKLLATVVEINFSAASYEAGIDAGFPVGSTDVE